MYNINNNTNRSQMEPIVDFVASLPVKESVWTLSEEARHVRFKEMEDELHRVWSMTREELAAEYYTEFIEAIQHCSPERQAELKKKYEEAKVAMKENYVVKPIPGHFSPGEFDVIMHHVRVNW